MNLFRKLIHQLKKQWLFSKPIRWPKYVHALLKNALKANNYKFLENDSTNFITYDISLSENGVAKFDFYQDNGTYVIRALINSFIPDFRMRDAMIMTCHLNNRLQTSNVYIHPERNAVIVISKIDLASIVAFPNELFNLIRQVEYDCDFCYEAFEKLIRSDQDPIFIITDLIEKINAGKANNNT